MDYPRWAFAHTTQEGRQPAREEEEKEKGDKVDGKKRRRGEIPTSSFFPKEKEEERLLFFPLFPLLLLQPFPARPRKVLDASIVCSVASTSPLSIRACVRPLARLLSFFSFPFPLLPLIGFASISTFRSDSKKGRKEEEIRAPLSERGKKTLSPFSPLEQA